MKDLEKAQREYLKRVSNIFDDSFVDINKISKIALMYHNKAFDFSNINVDYEKLKKENYLVDDLLDGINTERGFNTLTDLCMLYKIGFLPTLSLIVASYVPTIQALNKLLIEDNPSVKESLSWSFSNDFPYCIMETIQNNVEKFLEEEMKKENEEKLIFKFLDNDIKKEAIEGTFKRVQEHLKNMQLGKTLKLDLTKFLKKNIQGIKDLKAHQDYMMEVFSNPKKFSRLYTKNNPHFMNKLSNDNIKYCKETDSFYFEELEKGLTIGYTEQNLIINIDKSHAIKGLNKLLESFELVTTDESKEIKEYVETIIKLVNEEKYSNYLPFKRIGKALGMSKNEARNYAKKILDSVNPNVFDKYYED